MSFFGDEEFFYVRVDLVELVDGLLVVIEVELIELLFYFD